MFGMGTGVSFRIWSPGKDREQAVRPARGRFVVGCDGSHSLSSGLLRLFRELSLPERIARSRVAQRD